MPCREASRDVTRTVSDRLSRARNWAGREAGSADGGGLSGRGLDLGASGAASPGPWQRFPEQVAPRGQLVLDQAADDPGSGQSVLAPVRLQELLMGPVELERDPGASSVTFNR